LVIIEPGEQALLERFGKCVDSRAILQPGAHLTWPWPIDKIYRYRSEQIQVFNVGFTPEGNEREPAVLWKLAHAKEDNFLVANREPGSMQNTNDASGKRTPPVSLLSGSIPVLYQITNVSAWAYNNEDAPALLQDIGTREIVRYMAGADLNELMSRGRWEAAQSLVSQIQAAADQHQLGARIISVGLQDLHPPVKVAEDYEKVIGAQQTRLAKILEAQADAIKTNAVAEGQTVTTLNNAQSERVGKEINALAQAALFTNQIPAFQAAPSVYVQRSYLKAFGRSTANARKYLLLTTNTHDVITFDLQESVAQDYLNLQVPEAKAK
jgi:regulator of protease activity HflC (stomatin/prohibitin superfamily)